MLFDWLVLGQVVPVNPAASVRGPRHMVRRGTTPVLEGAEARQLLEAIDTTSLVGLRDRAFIGKHQKAWGAHAARTGSGSGASPMAMPGCHPAKRARRLPSSVRVRV